MLKIFFVFILSLSTYAFTDVTASMGPAQEIPGYTAGVNQDIVSCYNPTNNTIVLSWGDNTDSSNPYYAVYDCANLTFSTTPTLIDSNYMNGISNNVYSCYNSTDNTVIFSWCDPYKRLGYYAIYDCITNNITTQPIQFTNSQVGLDVYCCYNSIDNTVFFSWVILIPPSSTSKATQYPYYAIYTGGTTNSITTPPKQIFATNQCGNTVFSSYNLNNNMILLTWRDKSNECPFYCVYKQGSFSTPAQIPTSLKSQDSVFSSFNSIDYNFLVSWTDQSSAKPMYSILKSHTRSFSNPQPVPSASPNYLYPPISVFSAYNPSNDTFLLSFPQNNSNPSFAICSSTNGSFSTTGTQLDNYSDGIYSNVFTSYSLTNNTFFLSWTDNSKHANPWFAIYQNPTPPLTVKKVYAEARKTFKTKFQK